MSEQIPPQTPGADAVEPVPGTAVATAPTQQRSAFRRFMSSAAGRNLGLVVALLALVIAGAITAPDTFLTL
ncbi:MAG: ABC transporter permease, partial [Microbacterium sp.]